MIFDAVLPTDNSRLTAGLNISDKVAMGTGIDTIIIDGNVGATEVIGLDATEWTNVSGVDVIRFGTAGAGTYRLALTNQLINQSDANNGQRITVINSDGSLITDVNSDVTIDMRQLDNSHFVDFYGSNAMSNTSAADGVGDDAVVNTIRVTEVTMSGNSNLNGGENTVFSLPGTTAYTTVGLSELILNGTIPATAIPATSLDAGLAWAVACNTKTAAEAADEVKAENTENPNSGAFTTPAHFALFDEAMATEGNSNILEIYNNAEITAGDLANVSNFSTIKFINDLGTSQLLNMTLTDSIVDALVDASHTSTATQTELLTVGAYDNLSNGSGSFARVNIQGSNLTGRSDVQILLGRGQDVVQTGAGDDVVVMAGNYIKGKYVALDPTTGFDMNSVANWDDDSDDDNDGIVDDADKNGVNEDTMTQLAVTDTVALGVGSNDTLITYGAIDFTGANITGVESLISYSDVTMTASQYAQFGRITFAGNITHTLTIVDNLLGNNAIDASTLVLYDNSANLSIDLTSFSNAAGGNVNNQTVIGTPTDKSDIGNIIIDANLPPVAVADTFTTANNVPIKIDVLKNDYDLNTTDVLTILSITDVSNTDGQVKINSDNTVTFTPASGYVGDASFQYAVSDGKTASTGTVTGKITAATSTYALTAAAASVSEGAPATFNLVTTNVVDGTDVAYTLTGIQAADVDGGALTGTVKVIGNAATINVPLLADKATEGVETLTVTVNTATASTIINDTSTAIPTVEVDIADFTNNAYAAQDGAENITIAAASWSGKILTVSAFDNIEDRLIIDGGWADVDAFIADNAAGAAGAFGVDAQGDIHIYSPNFDEILLTGVNAQASTTLTGAVDAGWISFA